ncbi:MAG: bifunctional nuclease family protein [Bacteroidia bacterium]|nr:bifunctional nuclease family protein [Bacteroidia bacterium]
MKKVRLEIVGLSYSQTQSGAYALVLGESTGSRRLPIIIGGFEAQAIAIELEKMTPTRPLTHDLFKAFSETFSIEVTEILIYNLVEGIFYAKLVCTDGTREVEIDARTSDAIALAVRFNCPIYTYEFILKSAGIVLDDETLPSNESAMSSAPVEEISSSSNPEGEYQSKSTEELKNLLQTALDDEQYELASKIRDEINNRKQS